ncbi:MAG: 4Fe-4S dicluster domain-containing protein [Deltaproteobacteria bacterium]|nr:4Fe-4S dicluster domain-containing protein [Deltaproteobacteria bacterium]
MEPLTASISPSENDFSACSGCSLCLLPCPVWRQKRDITFTWQGRARALQQGAAKEDLRESIFACAYCGSCDPICPQGIDLRGNMAQLRGNDENNPFAKEICIRIEEALKKPVNPGKKAHTLLVIGDNDQRIEKIRSLLSGKTTVEPASDKGRDIVLAIEAGLEIPEERLEAFINPLKKAKEIIVSNGILKRPLKHLLPGLKVRGLGQVLSSLPQIRSKLKPTDFYIIESRAYNWDLQSMVVYYDKLRRETGAIFNLDLNRIAIPTTATSIQQISGIKGINAAEQVKWLLEGREVKRIVVESVDDGEAFSASVDIPVIHLSDLGEV